MTDHDNFNKIIKDKFVNFEKNFKQANNEGTPNYNFNSIRTNKESQTSRPYYGHCFGCKKLGHRYTECRTISPKDIRHIRDNFKEYLDEYKKQKKDSEKNETRESSSNSSLNSTGVSSPQKPRKP